MTSAAPLPPVLRVLSLQVPAFHGAPVAVGDGSAPGRRDGRFSGCAAITAGGTLLAAWYEHDPLPQASVYAEWQALRLGTRLAASQAHGQVSTVVTDNWNVAACARRVLAGGLPDPRVLGISDPAAALEISRNASECRLAVTWRPGKPDRDATSATPLGRAVHAAAWLVRRMAEDGTDPAGQAQWLASVAADPPRWRDELRGAYRQRFTPGSAARQARTARPAGLPGSWLPAAAGICA